MKIQHENYKIQPLAVGYSDSHSIYVQFHLIVTAGHYNIAVSRNVRLMQRQRT